MKKTLIALFFLTTIVVAFTNCKKKGNAPIISPDTETVQLLTYQYVEQMNYAKPVVTITHGETTEMLNSSYFTNGEKLSILSDVELLNTLSEKGLLADTANIRRFAIKYDVIKGDLYTIKVVYENIYVPDGEDFPFKFLHGMYVKSQGNKQGSFEIDEVLEYNVNDWDNYLEKYTQLIFFTAQ